MRVIVYNPICAWCESELPQVTMEVEDDSPDMKGISHGICEVCSDKLIQDAERYQKNKEASSNSLPR